MPIPPQFLANIQKNKAKGGKKSNPAQQAAAKALLAARLEDAKDGGKDDAKENLFGKVVKK